MLRERVLYWVDKRTRDMLAAPRAWGSDEAVEMQVLLLLQFRLLALRPDFDQGDPGSLVDHYLDYISRAYPGKSRLPLHRFIETDRLGVNLAKELKKVVQDINGDYAQEENPFQRNELAIRLVFEEGRVPAAAAFTGYYEEFRRAARAIARRSDKAVGRAPKGIEEATDFTLSDVRVTPKNGSPAEALLLLGSGLVSEPSMRDPDAEHAVRDAIVDLVTLAEWAASEADVRELPMDDREQRDRATVQAMRIVPRRGIEKVEIGGALIGRSKPAAFKPEHERRFLKILESSAPFEVYDETGEVRGIDLDRGVVIIDRQRRLPCYVRPEHFQRVTEVGVRARVEGTRYKPPGRSPFVIVSRITPLSTDPPTG